MSAFDWPALMRAGIQGLRLQPDQFWRLTPAELCLMLGQNGGRRALNKAGLNALLSVYPDDIRVRENGSD